MLSRVESTSLRISPDLEALRALFSEGKVLMGVEAVGAMAVVVLGEDLAVLPDSSSEAFSTNQTSLSSNNSHPSSRVAVITVDSPAF